MAQKSNRSAVLCPKTLLKILCILFAMWTFAGAEVHRVGTPDALEAALAKAVPGDRIVLEKGDWRDAELSVHAIGTAEKPIWIGAESVGTVVLSGLSHLKISGSHLIVEGLVFRDGHTPTSEVISFRREKGEYANYCRLTKCVIDNFNHPERTERETWVALYGKHNRVDHCYFTDKRVAGVTMTVRLVDEACQENYHSIDHNYFGYRQSLGSNGGETLRIGTSTYSLSNSFTEVVDNVFEGCNGETEIVSIKSCGNLVARNLFYECQGSVVFRHGNQNRVESNWFVGNSIPETGGVRVINQGNRVYNNWFQRLAGENFRAALVIMNGVPNSPLNRYMQVQDAEIIGNTYEDCDTLLFGAGSDSERTLTAVNSEFHGNLIKHSKSQSVFQVLDAVDGIAFGGNTYEPAHLRPAFDREDENKDASVSVGCDLGTPPELDSFKQQGAVASYGWKDTQMRFGTGETVLVPAGTDTLTDAVKKARAGDILELEAGATYVLEKSVEITSPITIRGSGNASDMAVVRGSKATVFTIENGGGLHLQNLVLDGSDAPDRAGNRMISTSRYSMNRNYRLLVENCRVENLNTNHTFDFFYAYPSTFADQILLKNTHFKNITGRVLSLDNEKDALGLYSVENLECVDCSFENVEYSAVQLYRRGSDESTFGPKANFTGCEFESVGNGKRNVSATSLDLHGAQGVSVVDCRFKESLPLRAYHTNGNPKVKVENCVFNTPGGVESNAAGLKITGTIFPESAKPEETEIKACSKG